MANTTCEIIWDRDHGTENEGYYARISGEGDVVLDATTADEARAEVARMYGSDVQITRCDARPEIDNPVTCHGCGARMEFATAEWSNGEPWCAGCYVGPDAE